LKKSLTSSSTSRVNANIQEIDHAGHSDDVSSSSSSIIRSSLPSIPVLLPLLAYMFMFYSIWFVAIAAANASDDATAFDMSAITSVGTGQLFGSFSNNNLNALPFNQNQNSRDSIHRDNNSSRYVIVAAKNNTTYNLNTTIHIVFSTDSTMIPLMMVSIISIIHKADEPHNLFFHVVLINSSWTTDFVNDMKKALGDVISLEVVTWDPLPSAIRNMKIRKRERQDLAAPANYARFYISQLFPSLHRFIYLDNDVMAHRSLSELWEVDMGTSKVGMVHDCGLWFHNHVVKLQNYNISHPVIKRIFGYELSKYQCHPNAGVMIVNEKLRRKYGDLREVEKLLALNQKEFLYKLGSQPLVVLTSWNHYLPLNNKWNVRTTSFKHRFLVSKEELGIFHFNGNTRKSFMVRILFSVYDISSVANATHVTLRFNDRTNTSRTIVIPNVVVEETVEDSLTSLGPDPYFNDSSVALNLSLMSHHANGSAYRSKHSSGHQDSSNPSSGKGGRVHRAVPTSVKDDMREELTREKYWSKISRAVLKNNSFFSIYVMDMLHRHIVFYQGMNIQLKYPKDEKHEEKHDHVNTEASKLMKDRNNHALLLKHYREKLELKRKRSNDPKR